MTEKPPCTYADWQIIVGKLEAKTFEELCYHILQRMGFENLNYRGGSADGGRDIEAEKTKIEPDGKTKIIEKYRFECKCYADGTIPWPKVCDKIHSANIAKIDKFVILSNQGLAPHAQDEIEKFKQTSSMRVISWTGFDFLDMLFRHPDLCDFYFRDESIPNIAPKETKPKHILKAVIQLGNNFGIEFQRILDKPVEINEENAKQITADALRNAFAKTLNITDKEKAIIYGNIAMIFCQFGYHEDALTFIDKALELEESAPFLDNKGYILERMHHLKESNEQYKKSLKLDKNNSVALNNLAHNLRRQGKLEEALKIIDEALILNPKYLTALNNKANILRDLRRFDEALNLLNKSIPEDSSLALQKTKIETLIDILDLKEAHRLNEKILELNPKDAGSINNKGVIFEHNAKFQNPEKYLNLAFVCFAKARELDPKFSLALSNQAVCFLNSGNFGEAEAIINAGLAIDKRDSHLLNNKAQMELHKGNCRFALKYADDAIRLHRHEKFLLTKAKILMQLRKFQEADRICKEILTINKTNADAMLILAESSKKRHLDQIAGHWMKQANEAKRNPISLLE